MADAWSDLRRRVTRMEATCRHGRGTRVHASHISLSVRP
jgi:hypothetical protein